MDIVTGVGVLDKAMEIVRAIADQPLNLTELQRVTGLPRATAHRLASALEEHGVLRRNVDGRYDLGPETAALGRIAAQRYPLAEVALPVVTELRDATGESAQLFVREGAMRRCVLSLPSPHALRWIVPDGALFPLNLGSAGRVLMGESTKSGWVHSVEEREPGVASVSAPVVGDAGVIIAAVSISGPIDRLTRNPGKRFGDDVVAAATNLTRLVPGTIRPVPGAIEAG